MLITVFVIGVVFAVILRDYDTVCFRALFAVLFALSLALILCSGYSNRITVSKRTIAVALAVAAFSFGVLRVSVANVSNLNAGKFSTKNDTVMLEISDINSNFLDSKVISSMLEVPKGTGVRFYPKKMPDDIVVGDKVVANVKYASKNDLNLLSKSIVLTATGDTVEQIEGEGVFHGIRKSVSDNSKYIFSHFEYAPAISKAVVTADKSGLDSYIYSLYKAGGLSHVLAISGLHISLIVFALNRFLSKLKLRYGINTFITLTLAVIYTALVGFSAGAVRACMLIVVSQLSLVFFRRADNITTLFLALFILILLNPYSAFSIGLQLSFVCSLGIVLINPMFEDFFVYFDLKRYESRKNRPLWWVYSKIPAIISPIFVSFAASVFSFPIICTSFDTTTALTPITNFILLPFFSLAVVITLFAFLLAPLSLTIATVIAYPAGYLFDLITKVNEYLYSNDIGIVSAKMPLLNISIIISVSVIISMIFLRGRKQEYAFWHGSATFCVTLAVCCFASAHLQSDKMIFSYSSDGAEYAYLKINESNTYVDLGGYTAESNVVFEFYDTRLDKYVIVDYNDYTLSSFKYLSGGVSVAELHLPKPKNVYEKNIHSAIIELANVRKCDIIQFEQYYIDQIDEETCFFITLQNEETGGELVCVDFFGKTIRLLCDGYKRAVNCDVAILSNNYATEAPTIISSEIFISEKTTNAACLTQNNTYTDSIVVEFDIDKDEMDIYEP